MSMRTLCLPLRLTRVIHFPTSSPSLRLSPSHAFRAISQLTSRPRPRFPTLLSPNPLTRSLLQPERLRSAIALRNPPTRTAASSTPENKDPAQTPSRSPAVKENIYTIPNALTTARLVLSPFIGYLIVSEQFTWALGTLVVAGLSDLVDGYVARKYNMKTVLGSALDPAADKVLMTVLTVSLCGANLLPLPLALLIVGRDVGLIAGTAWYRYKSLPPPKTAARYFDLSLPSAEVRPPFISKLNTLLQLTLMSLSVAAPVFGYVDWIGLEALRWVVGATTIWSGAQYVFDKNVIKILPQPK